MEVLPLLEATPSESMCFTVAAVPSIAGIYDAFLDGTNNSTADREAAIQVQQKMPDVSNIAKENRSFLRRSIRYMLGHGIKQFIDVGSGFLTNDNTHGLVHSIDPDSKVVYVDMNPAVVEEGNKLLATNDTATMICADIREPYDVLKHSDITRFIDFSEPVGVLMMCVACFFTDSEITHIMSAIRSTICDGSYVAVTHDTLDGHQNEKDKIVEVQETYSKTSIPLFFRNRKEVSLIFQGLQLVDPGVVFLHKWRVELDLPAPAAVEWLYGGMAKKSSSQSALGVSPQNMNLVQLRKCLNTTTITSTSLFFIIWWFVTILAQSFMDVGIVSFQQLKDMALEWDGSQQAN